MTAPKDNENANHSLAARSAAKDAIIEAVLLCDFSRIFDTKFKVGESTMGLAAVVQAKQELLRASPNSNDRLRRRAVAQLEVLDIEGARYTLGRIEAKP